MGQAPRPTDPLRRIGESDHGNRKDGQLWALRDINLQVQQGEILGIIGRNGAGKSALLKIGLDQPALGGAPARLEQPPLQLARTQILRQRPGQPGRLGAIQVRRHRHFNRNTSSTFRRDNLSLGI